MKTTILELNTRIEQAKERYAKLEKKKLKNVNHNSLLKKTS